MKGTQAALSPIDEERFGVKTAKAEISDGSVVSDVIKFCTDNGVQLLIVRCPTSDLVSVQKLERQGCLLMDTLIYYGCNLRGNPPPDHVSEILVRSFKKGDEADVRRVAAQAFDGYYGHYHADSRLDRAKCNETYVDWASKSCLDKRAADQVFIAEHKGEVVGFGTMKANSPDEGQYILGGILPLYQGRGVNRMILINCMSWCIDRGIGSMITATQITNLAAQKVWIRLSFEPGRSYYTFHKWFDFPPDTGSSRQP